MSLLNILFIAIALSFDAMAVAAANGAHHHQMGAKKALKIAFYFGFFQFLMPLIGYILGFGLIQFISGVDHWIAFFLLVILGIKMLVESFKKEEEKKIDIHSFKILLTQSIATSIDALIIGVTLALLPVNIWLSVSIIGLTTFILSLISIYIGKKCGEKWGKKAEIIGGLVLISIGLKILLEHIL
ncbi:MAG: manganese efflux pump MntP family protein [Patescibacteria group bacterium]|nr:manganese efflux pump MntP family protein [Patescibacteria group bacterium]